MHHFTRPRPVAWFFFLLGFGTCLVLGTWQMERLRWKEGLIAEIAAANAATPVATIPQEEGALTALQFRRAALSGTWLAEHEFHLAPRYWRDQFGYVLITPLKLADGRILMVNRGWVPAKKKDPQTRPETAVRGKARIEGMLRIGNERGAFSPPNQSDGNLWFGRDVAAMAAHAKLEGVIPAMLDIVGVQEAGVLPVPSDGTIRLRNDHLSYIITWYGIALGILVIFLTYHRKRAAN